ncbi:MAG: calcium-binding protein [Gemmataceae bacterium]
MNDGQHEFERYQWSGGSGGVGGAGVWGASGGVGGEGGIGQGGGLFAEQNSIYLYANAIAGIAAGGNSGNGGDGGTGGTGGKNGTGTGSYIELDGSGHPIGGSSFKNGPGGLGGKGGDTYGNDGGAASGGAVYLGNLITQITSVNNTFTGRAVPGRLGKPGAAGPGGMPGPDFAYPQGSGPDSFHEASGAGKAGEVIRVGQDGEKGQDNLHSSAGSLTINNHSPGPVAGLIFSPIPFKIALGDPLPYPVFVVAFDQSHRVAGEFNGFIHLKTDGNQTRADNLYHELGGTADVQASNGVAIFNNLSVENHRIKQHGKVMDQGRSLYATSPALGPLLVFGSDRFDLVPGRKVTATYSMQTDTLKVVGTDTKDNIEIRQGSDGQIRILVDIRNLDGTITTESVQIKIIETGKTRSSIGAGGVSKITVDGLGGDDTIRLDLGSVPIRAATMLDGGPGDDLIVGAQKGINEIFGGSGDDQLYGGDAHDSLTGDEGNDALCGQDEDSLTGGIGSDRFLLKDVALTHLVVKDYIPGGEDVLVHIDPGQTIKYPNGSQLTGKAWTDDEIRRLDFVFAKLLNSGFRRLLQQANGAELVVQRVVEGGAWNAGSYIAIGDFPFNQTPDDYLRNAFLHEIGHNWDEENPHWDEFKALSGWRSTDPHDSTNYEQGHFLGVFHDWWYLSNTSSSPAKFVSIYHPNPLEDFAECFTAYFTQMFNWPWNVSDPTAGADKAPEKMTFITAWANSLQNF